MAGNPAPGYLRKPDHVVAIAPYPGRIAVSLGGAVIADSARALAFSETGYGVAYYIPMADVRMDLAALTEHSTHCPFKGNASYYAFAVDGRRVENAAWSYAEPYDEAGALKGHLAFYTNRVDAVSVA